MPDPESFPGRRIPPEFRQLAHYLATCRGGESSFV
jgi:hypothetical protein